MKIFKSIAAGFFLGSAIASLAVPSAQAALISPVSYDMQNGDTVYLDLIYTGSGSPGIAQSSLSGGLGDLTDGVIPTGNFTTEEPFTTSSNGPYVGWSDFNPTITFNFGTTVGIDSVTLYVDDSGGAGGVTPPSSVTIGTTNYTITNPSGIDPFGVTISGLGLSASSLDIQLFGNTKWIFLSEVTFESSTEMPEPGTLAILGLGLAGLGFARRRKAA